MNRYLIPALFLALIVALFVSLQPESSSSDTLHVNGKRITSEGDSKSATTETAPTDISRTKSRIRDQHPKPTIDETTKLLQTTIIPKVDFQDLTLSEVTAALNTHIKDAGIPPHKLKVVISNSELSKLRVRELRIRNIPLATTFKYLCDSTKLCYRAEPGIVRFYNITENLPEIEPPYGSPAPINSPDPSADPFAEPNPVDPFADPFAERKIPTSQ